MNKDRFLSSKIEVSEVGLGEDYHAFFDISWIYEDCFNFQSLNLWTIVESANRKNTVCELISGLRKTESVI